MNYQIPGYTILHELSHGGMGTVYLATQDALQREVAIKILSDQLGRDPDIVERFRREARTAAQLRHRNIVNIYDVGTHEGVVYLTMEYLRGEDLDARVRRGMSMDQAIDVVCDVARALAHAHRQGIVHRDIKPQNIMFREDGTTVLTDFGIAKRADVPELTQAGSTIGTPHYMSPEQVRAGDVDGRSDLYSLGIVFYRMLTGKPPFDAETLFTVAYKHVTESVPPLPARFSSLQPIMDRLLAKPPEARFQTADELIRALEVARREGVANLPIGGSVNEAPSAAAATTLRTAIADGATQPIPTARSRAVEDAPTRSKPSLADSFRRVWRQVTGSDRSEDTRPADPLETRPTTQERHTSPPPPPPPRRAAPARENTIPGGRTGEREESPTLERTIISTGPLVPPPQVTAPPASRTGRTSAAPPFESGEMTQIFSPEKWAPPPKQSDAQESEYESEGTRLFPMPGSPAGSTSVPVALSITQSADPRQQGTRVACERFPFTIGRAETADLSLPADRALSRTHVAIDRDETGFVIRDLSSNGVYINGRHVHGVTEPLVFGTTIVLSKDTVLTFVAELPALPDLTGRILGDRYVLGERIHHGMKGATYSARDRRLPRRPLAVKIFAPTLLQLAHYRNEFMSQAELAAQLMHPNISKVLEFGEARINEMDDLGEVSFLCFEFMEGGNLTGRLEADPLPAMDDVVQWIERLAEALDHAHRNGVVHGDIKPACIIFDRDGRPYLTDFALGSSRESEPAQAVLGTPAYMAPERWVGDPASEATDQYSLAVLAYLVVTGTRPHEGQADPDVRQRNFRRGPPPAHEEAQRSGRKDVTRALSAVLDKALSVDPAARYPTILEFGQAFVRAIRQPGRRHSQPRIFISYQRESSAGWAVHFAHQLKTDHALSVFVDTLAKDGAPTIPDRIRQEIAECDVFVCFLAPHTLDSNWVRQEIEIAVQESKPMVPIYHEDFRTSDEERHKEESIRRLLAYDAVQLLDRRNIHIEHTITDLVDRIRKFVS